MVQRSFPTSYVVTRPRNGVQSTLKLLSAKLEKRSPSQFRHCCLGFGLKLGLVTLAIASFSSSVTAGSNCLVIP